MRPSPSRAEYQRCNSEIAASMNATPATATASQTTTAMFRGTIPSSMIALNSSGLTMPSTAAKATSTRKGTMSRV